MLGTITTQPTSAGMPIIEQQTEVFMTWVQMKNLVQTMQTVLQMIELEVGPIPVVPPSDPEAALDSIRAHVRNLNFPQRSQP
jgi:hypothetical protein